jgi:enamine deaminase RidA (YjgF/YER057c/UK114 family)
MEDPEARLSALGLILPPAPAALANYVPYINADGLLFVSGQISKDADGRILSGCLGHDCTVELGVEAARFCALNILAQAKAALGSLSAIEQIVRITGFVAATAQFRDHPKVVNGASDLFVSVLGKPGRHTRAAVGVASLPMGAAVEIDAILKVR